MFFFNSKIADATPALFVVFLLFVTPKNPNFLFWQKNNLNGEHPHKCFRIVVDTYSTLKLPKLIQFSELLKINNSLSLLLFS